VSSTATLPTPLSDAELLLEPEPEPPPQDVTAMTAATASTAIAHRAHVFTAIMPLLLQKF
jgi:hypothetical protein